VVVVGEPSGSKARTSSSVEEASERRKRGRAEVVPQQQARAPQEAEVVPHASARTSSTTLAHVTSHRFDALRGTAGDATLRAIREVLGYEFMTRVQAEALPVCCAGRDVVAKAKTGTGKTIAFMVPTLERAAEVGGIGGLVLSPTRELAQQTLEEGKLLSRFYGRDFGLACFVGGVAIKKDYSALSRSSCRVLVATPGRLNDHLENTEGFAARLSAHLRVLVFDEADQLLDMGFRPAIERLLAAISSTASTRQTLLFSATLPADVESIARIAMRPGYTFIDTIGAQERTHQDVAQEVSVCAGVKEHSVELLLRLEAALAADPTGHKIIVFFTTARLTQFYAELLAAAAKKRPALAKTRFLEIHSRKSQSHREKISKLFREAPGAACLLTSDVSARGLDYPDVTLVLQFGAPSDAQQYVHRLGRTARGDGLRGKGQLLLADFERYFLDDPAIKALPIARLEPLADDAAAAHLDDAARALPDDTVGSAYQAWLGFHNSYLKKLKWSKDHLVATANDWASQVAMRPTPPPLQAKTVAKMNLKGTRGLVLDSNPRANGGRAPRGPPPPPRANSSRARRA